MSKYLNYLFFFLLSICGTEAGYTTASGYSMIGHHLNWISDLDCITLSHKFVSFVNADTVICCFLCSIATLATHCRTMMVQLMRYLLHAMVGFLFVSYSKEVKLLLLLFQCLW